VNEIADGVRSKQAILEGTLTDLVGKMDTLQEHSIKHARAVNEMVTKEVTRMEKITSTLE
jgi:hypothetical protein